MPGDRLVIHGGWISSGLLERHITGYARGVFEMKTFLRKLFLYLKLIWHVVYFYGGGSMAETYHSAVGRIQFELENYRKAIRHFEKSEMEHDGRNYDFSRWNQFHLGYCFMYLGDYQESLDHFYKYLAIIPSDSNILGLVGWCNAMLGRLEAALEYYSRLLEIEPEEPEVHLACFGILLDLKRKEDAVTHLRRAARLETSHEIKDVICAYEEAFFGDRRRSIQSIQEIIPRLQSKQSDKWPTVKQDLNYMLSWLQREEGDLAGALSALEIAVEENPYDLHLVNALAYEYAEQGKQLVQAMELVGRAIREEPKNANFIDTKGWIFFKMGNLDMARKLIEESLGYNPISSDAQEHMKVILEEETKKG